MRVMVAKAGFFVAGMMLLGAQQGSVHSLLPGATDDAWITVPPQSLDVDAGSPLDFSGLVADTPAGSDGPLRVAPDGALMLGAKADPRFNCAMIANGPGETWALPDHAEADRLATQLRRHGYDLVRFHFMDARLMVGAKADFAFDPEKLDRYYYLLAALKRNGIYWMLDIMTAPDGGRRQDVSAPHSVNNIKARLNFDPAAQREWLRLLDAIYAQRNPYTGMTPLADPALAFVVGANENSLAFWSPPSRDGPYPAGLAARFDQWMRTRYADAAALARALPDSTTQERSGAAPIAAPAGWTATGPRMVLFRQFLSDLEVGSYDWMTHQLRDRGYAGPLLAFPEWYKLSDNRTRSRLPITDIHAYAGEVSSYATGAPLRLPSSIEDDGLTNWLSNAAARWLGRPLVASEYGAPFPNPYRGQSGLLFPALSAFQGYSTICRMASLSVEPAIPADGPKTKPIYPYSVGIDPVARVAETLSTLLFYRRDVAPAGAGGVAIPFGDANMRNAGSAFLPLGIRRAALLTRFGLIAPEKVASLPTSFQIAPVGSPPQGLMEKAVARLVDMTAGTSQAQSATLVSSLFASGVLPKGNKTDVARGIYQSQTGEMTLDQSARRLSIVTPRTEAVSVMGAQSDVTLNSVTIRTVSDGALIAASALDGKTLNESGKILLMLVGDARNSNMALSGTGTMQALVNWGQMPILLQRVSASLALRHHAPFRGTLRVLSLNGRVIASSPVTSGADGTVSLTLDTAAVRQNPSTFFILEASRP